MNKIPGCVYDTKDFVEDETGELIEIQHEEKDKSGKIIQDKIEKIGKKDKLAMRYAEIVPIVVKAIQEIKAEKDSEIAELKEENKELRDLLADAIKRIEKLEEK